MPNLSLPRGAVIGALLLPAVLFPLRSLADSFAAPQPRTFWSEERTNRLQVLPLISLYVPEADAGTPGRGVAFGVFYFRDSPSWYRELVNIPARAYVGEGGAAPVVTVDTYARTGHAHSIVIYGTRGKLVADHPLEALVPAEEIARHIRPSVSNRPWANYDTGAFSEDGKQFSIETRWGRTVTIELASGRVLPNDE